MMRAVSGAGAYGGINRRDAADDTGVRPGSADPGSPGSTRAAGLESKEGYLLSHYGAPEETGLAGQEVAIPQHTEGPESPRVMHQQRLTLVDDSE